VHNGDVFEPLCVADIEVSLHKQQGRPNQDGGQIKQCTGMQTRHYIKPFCTGMQTLPLPFPGVEQVLTGLPGQKSTSPSSSQSTNSLFCDTMSPKVT
jgi:hypothetical protein